MSENEPVQLKDLKVEHFDWRSGEFIEIAGDVRLYWQNADDVVRFACICCTGNEIYPRDIKPWDAESWGEIYFDGYALFDGVRHLWFTGHRDGYFNYPNLDVIIKALSEVRKLELRFCWDCDGGTGVPPEKGK